MKKYHYFFGKMHQMMTSSKAFFIQVFFIRNYNRRLLIMNIFFMLIRVEVYSRYCKYEFHF